MMTAALRVLYVDDEPDLLEIGQLFLEASGDFSVATSVSAQAALELLKREQFDAIISDYQMPGMDGIQFLVEVRKNFEKIPFILFTGRGREEIVIQAINKGADFYLQKGGEPQSQFAELEHKIRIAVERRTADKAFNDSENRYHSLVNTMHDCVAVYRALADGEDFEFIEFNKAAEKSENLSRTEVIGRRVTEVFPGVREFGLLDVFRRVWQTGISETFPVSFYKDNRISGWRDNFIYKLPSGEIVADYSDETARKQAEEALKKSEEQYRSVVETTGTGYVVLDKAGRVITANPEYLRLTGRSTFAEIEGRSVNDWTAPYDLERNVREVEKCLTKGQVRGLEIDYLKPDGTIQPIEINASVIQSDSGQIILTLCRDISSRKQIKSELERKNQDLMVSYEHLTASEEELRANLDEMTRQELALRESEARLLLTLDVGNAGMWEWNPETNEVRFDARFHALLGYALGELPTTQKEWLLYHNPDDVPVWMAKAEAYLRGDSPVYESEHRIRNKSGDWSWIFTRGRFADPPAPGTPRWFIGFAINVTDRKRADEALRESEDRFRGIFDTITSGVAIYEVKNDGASGKDYIIKDFNRTALEIEGKKKEEVIGKSLSDLRPAIDEYGLIPVFQQVSKTGVPGYFPQKVYIDEKYSSWYENRVFRLQSGEIVAVYDDITGRKRAEEALQKSEQDLKEAQAIAQLGRWELDLVHNTLHWSDGIYQLFEINPAKFGATYEAFLNCIHPDDRDRVNTAYTDSLKTKKPYEISHRLLMKDGRIKWVNEICNTEYDSNGQPLRSVGIVQDITEIKRAEEKLKTSEEKYRLLFTSMIDGFALLEMIYDKQGKVIDVRYIDVNPAHEKLTGLKREAIIGRTARESIPGLEDYWIENYGRVDKTGSPEYFENYVGGLNRWFGVSVYRTSPGFVAVNFENITERKRVEEALREQEKEYRNLVELASEGVWHLDKKFLTVYVNPAMEDMLGYSKEEMTGRSWYDFGDPKWVERAKELEKRRESGIKEPHEFLFIHKDGRKVLTRIATTPLYDKDGNFNGAIGVLSDITRLKDAEEAVHAAVKLNQLIDTLSVEESMGYTLDEAERCTNSKIGFFHLVNPDENTLQLVTWSTETKKHCYISKEPDLNYPVSKAGVWVDCLRERRPVIHNDYASMPHKKGMPEGHVPVIRELVVPIFDEDKIVAIIGVGNKATDYDERDINVLTLLAKNTWTLIQRKKSEESLRETKDYLENLISYANAPIIVWNPDFEITRFNHAFEELTGRTEQQVLGKRLEILFPEESCNASMELIQKVLSGERWKIVEIPILHASSGEVRIVLWNSANISTPDGTKVLATIAQGQDITERKVAEESLRETKEYLENLISYANAPIIVWNPDFEITRFNHAFEELTGRTEQQVLGKSLEILFPTENCNASMELIQKALSGERWKVVEIPILHAITGEVRIVLWNSANILTPNRTKVLATIAQGQDITERKELEKEMEYHEQELRNFSTSLAAANKKLTLLSSITRHDINNQMTALRGYTSLLQRKQPDPTAFSEYFMKINAAAERISAMIQFTREYDSIGVKAPVWQDCRLIVDNAAKDAPLGKIIVKNDLPAGAEVFADTLIVKVFYNLMDNAVRYGRKISTIRFSVQETGENHLIVCEDDGDGVVSEEKEKIFERGFGKNTGLGLFLSREILGISGITIKETGEPGKGARFEMTVPKDMWRMNPAGGHGSAGE